MATPPTPSAPASPPTAGAPPGDASLRPLLSIARSLALLLALLAGLLFLVFLAFAFLDLVLGRGPGDVVSAVYCLASAAVNYVLWREIPALERLAEARQYSELRERTIVWAVLGLIFFVIVGVLLLVVWLKAELLVSGTKS